MKELREKFTTLQKEADQTARLLRLDAMKARYVELEAEMNEPDFWSNQRRAKGLAQEFETLRREIATWDALQSDIKEGIEFLDMALEEGGADAVGSGDVARDLEKKYDALRQQLEALEFLILLNEKYDERGAMVAIHAGAGGVDAQDWAEMLLRMLLRFCERRGFTVNMLERAAGQEAGVKRAVFEIGGRYAYGYLQSESGVHRLVRMSPFDAEGMRHTSFALVEVLPAFADVDEVVLKEDDVRIDVFRSGGAGGQSVNTTDSAVRIVHEPTGITVVCQNERSQVQNKATAMRYLKAKLRKHQQQVQNKEKQQIRGEFASAEWGNQIRSYVIHPYKLVKDHRTEYEETDPSAVLDGGLDGFVESFLRWRREEQNKK
ncbi:MAG: peptide chain release factor 2 [Candidatus Kerfeldbacteria bacterium RIFCSPHIGHO2_12_FULL_48_17]|uniref:Peptide chain release factor 2 n=1 Tax=Candidatus Kerfeldbacteria bacterium RIFCSPHIGHO2_12_FULL_48_17 TaxID=1798542 RepID=A0A1G2B3D9_9BACT|nr:MAG: peptide chain release factor 2 [Candidatus Kerfeldbacteria bacterium RIFCSPHIGHO2_12_FULL_48_17]